MSDLASGKLNKRMVKSSVLSELFGVTTRRVQQLAQEGVLSVTKDGNENHYELSEAIKEYITYLNERVDGKGNKEVEGLETQKLKAETEYKQAKAKMVNLELKELEGQMHRSEDVEFMLEDMILNIRQLLLSLPGRLAVSVKNAKSPKVIAKIINDEICSVLTQLSDYSYDPNFYKQRVRERKGWEQEDEVDEN